MNEFVPSQRWFRRRTVDARQAGRRWPRSSAAGRGESGWSGLRSLESATDRCEDGGDRVFDLGFGQVA
jgi:hypothetical protein